VKPKFWGKRVNAWSTRFDELTKLPNGRKIVTLKDAISWLAKEVPKSEHGMKQFRPPPTKLACR
jgi:hypothetical protein